MVGIGASDGGLEAIERLFDHLPANLGAAYVLVQRFPSDFKSLMNRPLARRTEMPIQTAEEGAELCGNQIYLIPPKTIARINNGRLRLESVNSDGAAPLPIDRFLESLAADGGSRGVGIILSDSGADGAEGFTRLRAEPLAAKIAEQQLGRIVANLIANAIEAISGPEGLIVLQVNRRRVADDEKTFLAGGPLQPGEYVSVAVENSGPSIADDQLDRIFDPFFTARFTGHGLGLAECLGLAHGMNGAMAVHNSPDSPVVFELLLPVRNDHILPVEAVCPDRWRGSGAVLVIDDSEGVRKLIETHLLRAGFNVVQASDGEQGLEILNVKRNEIDVVLADMVMPRLGGLDVIRSMRKLNLDIPALLMTGFIDLESLALPKDLAVAGYIVKPVTAEQLRRELDRVLAGKTKKAYCRDGGTSRQSARF